MPVNLRNLASCAALCPSCTSSIFSAISVASTCPLRHHRVVDREEMLTYKRSAINSHETCATTTNCWRTTRYPVPPTRPDTFARRRRAAANLRRKPPFLVILLGVAVRGGSVIRPRRAVITGPRVVVVLRRIIIRRRGAVERLRAVERMRAVERLRGGGDGSTGDHTAKDAQSDG